MVSDSFVTPWTVACQVPLYMEFPRKESWSGLPFSPPGESSQSKDQASVSCIAGAFFTAEPSAKPPKKIKAGKNTAVSLKNSVRHWKGDKAAQLLW